MDWIELTAHEPGGVAGAAPPVVVRGADCRTGAELFAEWARALEFPAHFGHNWDAFHDCLTEKALWHYDPDGPPPAQPLTIRVEDAAQLLADAPARDLTVLLTALSDTATVQQDDEDEGAYPDGFRIHLHLLAKSEELPYLESRLRMAGFRR
ncbi:Barstar (barnase inhibitor) [Streptomyces sp. yr375]|uniref:barstar family protein n=1 Tax=Streptomyces sp. yr375 TaxID=1761906 RepID=UPI0008C84EC3|nr:barstar family protein [Streptomyces sp. yr375]SES46235.1 Barstar (barnase inhibitor) [Streptomyces sp. yr375]